MAHRSRLCAIMIDCPPDATDAGVDFWGKALNMPPHAKKDASDPYVFLEGRAGGLFVLLQRLQRVEDDARVHLDFETDDVEAEVRRLEALGARRKENMGSFWIMEAPSGHIFCVVPPQSDDFPADAQVWDD
ncbi:MAG: VOC family protein [Chloroflexi bacterium]|nr:VOC family protein [Chloroflexota bacterium]